MTKAAVLTALPPASLDRHLAILGTSDAGKTYAAKGEVEKLLDRGARACIIDPTGVWWGLRLREDGKTPSKFEVVIFGGDHADIPLTGAEGARLAELVSAGTFSCVIDVKRLSVGKRTRLFADFAERLAEIHAGDPLHLLIDEAHQFMPQGGGVSDFDRNRMLNAGNNLVAGGRSMGLRLVLISQRPAKLHKDSLTQVQTLVALLNISPQDRKAVGDWIADSADKEAGRAIIASLPGLPRGEGWVWAPRLGVLSRIKFPTIITFDSSATPEAGQERSTAKPAGLDLDALKLALAGPPEAESPKGGKTEGLMAGEGLYTKDELEAACAAAEKKGYAEGFASAQEQIRYAVDRARREVEIAAAEDISRLAKHWLAPGPKTPFGIPAKRSAAKPAASDPASGPRSASTLRGSDEVFEPDAGALGSEETSPHPAPPRAHADDMPAAQAELVNAARFAPRQVDWSEAAILSGRMPAGGYFERARKALRDSGLPEPPPNDPMWKEGAPPYAELIDRHARRFAPHGAGEKIFRLLASWSGPLDRTRAARQLGLAEKGGYWERGWKAVRSSPLTVEREDGVDLAPILRDLQRAEAAR